MSFQSCSTENSTLVAEAESLIPPIPKIAPKASPSPRPCKGSATERKVVKVTRAWAAGFIDGEGNFLIQRSKRPNGDYYYPRLCATNTNRYALDCLAFTYGGTVLDSVNRKKARHKKTYRWWLSGWKAGRVALTLIPRLLIKKEQAKLFVRFCEYRDQKAPNLITLSRMKNRMTRLNRRGT